MREIQRIMVDKWQVTASSALPLPCEYFDLICGTGTGGFIAIMLGRLRMVRSANYDMFGMLTRFSRSMCASGITLTSQKAYFDLIGISAAAPLAKVTVISVKSPSKSH